jgi:hypothetical protein
MAANHQSIQSAISTLGGGRDFQQRPATNFNTGDLSQGPLETREQIFSQIPEDSAAGDPKTNLEWDGAIWFPDDLGSEANAYYVKFDVYILDTGKSTAAVKGDSSKDVEFDPNASGPRMTQNLQNEGTLRNIQTKNIPTPKLKKLNEIIALPMPDSIVTDHSTMWSRAEGGLISAAIAMGDKLLSSQSSSEAAAALGAAAKAASLGAVTGIASLLESLDLEGSRTNLKLLTKRAPNPRNEFLFDGVNNRSFNLQWKFIPRSEGEAIKLRFILEKMKLYMYPELEESTAGNFYLFPAMFDITFMHGAQENEWLYRTSTCALTNMIINYTGAGQWIATSYNGAPFAWEVTMQFTEVEFLHRKRFKNYANPNGVAR